MGRLPTGNRQYQIEHVWNVHHEITRLALIGMKSVDIAHTLNISPVTVSYTLNSTIVRRQLDIMRAARDVDALEVSRNIKNLAPRAVKVLEELMECELPNIKLSSAKDVLDRAGFPAVKEVNINTGRTYLTKDEIEDIKARARHIGLTVVPTESIIDVGDEHGQSELGNSQGG
uniref:Uncharacterized protein n=1 Tax=viral metagenome TaxID=1070528 RepID=A0A6M3KLP7_9ZZZZ